MKFFSLFFGVRAEFVHSGASRPVCLLFEKRYLCPLFMESV
jgi:hypothetical protein